MHQIGNKYNDAGVTGGKIPDLASLYFTATKDMKDDKEVLRVPVVCMHNT